MSREIKFRAWDTKCERWVIPTGITLVGTPFLRGDGYIEDSVNPDTDLVLMQYTGLRDKNGMEIYHKDIAKYFDDAGRPRVGMVEWQAYRWALEALDGDDEGNYDIELLPAYLAKVKVIGNIYEHPELLTQ